MGIMSRSKKGQMITLLFVLIIFNIVYFAGLAGLVQSMGVAAFNNDDSWWSWFAGNMNLFIIIIDAVSVFAIVRFG